MNSNPKGAAVTVYYDPDNPSESVLCADVPGIMYFMVLFLQPFLLVGLALIAWTITLPWTHRRLVNFFSRRPSLPWTIPSWGVAREDADGIRIHKSHRPGGGIWAFLSGLWPGMLRGDLCRWHPCWVASAIRVRAVIGRALEVAACVGVAALVRKLFLAGGASVLIDPINRRLSIRSRLRDEQVSFDKIKSWRLRQIPYPAGLDRERPNGPISAAGGSSVGWADDPVHAFKPRPGRKARRMPSSAKPSNAWPPDGGAS